MEEPKDFVTWLQVAKVCFWNLIAIHTRRVKIASFSFSYCYFYFSASRYGTSMPGVIIRACGECTWRVVRCLLLVFQIRNMRKYKEHRDTEDFLFPFSYVEGNPFLGSLWGVVDLNWFELMLWLTVSQAPLWGPWPDFSFFLYFVRQLLCSSSWGALSDERTGL
jgi:hypothetical protein